FEVLDLLRDFGRCPILLEVHKTQGIHIVSHGLPLLFLDIEAFELMRARVELIGNLLGLVLRDKSITILIHSKSNDNVIIFRILNGEFANCIWKFCNKTRFDFLISRWIITSRPYFSSHSVYT